MIKKITAVITALAILASLTAFASFYDVDENGIYAQSVERLVRYGVLSGKGDGYFDPDAGLTRAELAKIATVIAGLDSLAAANTGTSLYSDMPGSHWASGYVNVAAKNQLILGYPDGTYAPEKSLTFAESVTVLLRLLGYTAEDLGDNWPSAYTAKAAELGMTSGMRYGDYDLISRADMALAADRALLTDMDKNDGEAGKKLIQRMDYTITDCIILATSKESKNLLSDEVSTTAGTYQKTDDSVDQYVTRRVKLVLNRDGKVVNVMPIAQTGGEVVIQGVIGTEIVYAANGVNGSMKLDDTSIVYHQGAKKTLSDIKGIMETGMTMAVYFSANGSYDYSVVKDFDMLGPVVVTADFTGGETSVGGYALNSGGLRVIRDGYGAQLSEIKAFDVVYYNTASNILYAYCDKVAGVYEKAYPNKAGVTKITLSGVEYELESQDAVQLFGEYPGAYKINDYMTILLGRDGKVAGAVNMNAADLTAYGVILSCGERISEEEETKGTKENFVNVFTVSGTEQEFKTDKDYTAYRGRVIKYQFSGGLMIPQFVTPRRISGKVDAQGGAIGDYRLTDGAVVVDLSYIPE
ncbi:MAG: S-layer homology domain-containing protein, partial [Clostridiales bacterium]|nr:S-layer homology domain-containing protein [Clostridiales bacterium]